LQVDRRWTWHYQTLVALRDHLVQEQQAPQSTDSFDRDFIRALLAREPDPLGEINAAIDRILQGDYGYCEKTGVRIAAARLRAAPWTRQRSG
jgi:RNA polymerase-binding transcription factor DksA